MGKYDLHSIALYLAGQYPNLFSDSYDKLDFKLELREITKNTISESITDEMQRTASNDKEFFYMWLHRLEKITRDWYWDRDILWEFLNKLDKEIPNEIKFLNMTQTVDRKAILLTEWKTDVKIINTAWEKLYHWIEKPFEIIESWIECKNWSAETLRNQLQNSNLLWKKWYTIIWLFDNDKEWNEQFKSLNKNGFEDYSDDKQFLKHDTYDIYWLLLPVPDNRKLWVWNKISHKYLQIEHYFSNDILEERKLIWSKISEDSEVFIIWWSKNTFSNKLEKIDAKEFENFKILFSQIKKLI